jgi:hypothetical protein
METDLQRKVCQICHLCQTSPRMNTYRQARIAVTGVKGLTMYLRRILHHIHATSVIGRTGLNGHHHTRGNDRAFLLLVKAQSTWYKLPLDL